jgi:hypothetical protein
MKNSRDSAEKCKVPGILTFVSLRLICLPQVNEYSIAINCRKGYIITMENA